MTRGPLLPLLLLAALLIEGAACARPAAREAELVPPAPYDVRILRDVWGVPHVFGRRDADAAFGLAYAHAEDDFATLQLTLVATRGELAAREGPAAAPSDYLVRWMGVWEEVEARYHELEPRTRALLEGYAAGIEHYAMLHPDEVWPGLLPVRGHDLAAGYVHHTPLFYGLHRAVGDLMREEPAGSDLPAGSNALAVAPHRSADGHTRLAVNSHQPWTGPVAWYEAHLHSEEGLDVVGGTFPGSPVILHGHNRHLGWAFTVNLPDLVDAYALELDPDDPRRYRLDGAWHELERESVALRVRLLGPFSWTFRRDLERSAHGPVLRTPRGPVAVRFARADVRAVEQIYRLNRAKSFAEWKDAMRLGALPSMNAVYADGAGNILYLYNARLPRRAPGFDWRGTVRGDTWAAIWREQLGFDEMPRVENPPSGFVQSCNSTPYLATSGPGNPDPAAFPERLGVETEVTNRTLRALELFSADPSISREEFRAIKLDKRYSERSDVARERARLLAAPAPEDPLLREARAVLRRWDLSTHAESREAALSVLTLEPVILAARERRRGRAVPAPDPAESLERVARTLLATHGRLDPPWSEVNRLRRGDLDLGLGGGPDVLRAIEGSALDERGRRTAEVGDSLVMLVEWDAEGRVASRSIHQFGSATLDAQSPHYADQSVLFASERFKPVWLDEKEIRAHLEREYRPGEELLPGGAAR